MRTNACLPMLLLVALVGPATAQEPAGRMRVLVPPFAGADRTAERLGERVADRLRRQISELPSHVAIERREYETAVREVGLRVADMDCIRWRQLGARINAGLVVCGAVSAAGGVTASFIAPDNASFEVPAFETRDEQQAAVRIVAAFTEFVEQISLAYYCAESIQSEAWTDAERQCRDAIARNPTLVSAQYHLASALIRLERIEEALQAFERVIELDPMHPEALLGAGVAASRLKRNEESMRHLEEYLRLNPGDVDVRLSVATRIANAGDALGALRLTEAALTESEPNAQLTLYAGHFAMAAALRLQDEAPAGDDQREMHRLMELALGYYARAEERGAEPDVTVHRTTVLALLRLGRLPEALAAGERAVAAHADDPATWSIFADVLRDAGRHADALAALDRVVAMAPDQPRLGARRAILLLELDRPDDAVAAAQQSIERAEIDGDAIERIAQTFVVVATRRAGQAQYPAALRYLDGARQIGRSERTIGMINQNHAYVLLKQGEQIQTPATRASAERALPLFRMAVQLLQSATGYTDGADTQRAYLANAQQWIEVQEAILRRR